MSKVLAPKGQGSRTYAIFELPGRQRLPSDLAFGVPSPPFQTLRVTRCGVSVGGLLIVHRLPALHALKTRRPGGVKAMNDYNLAADLLATFRASPDIIKALLVIIPPAFCLALLKLLLSVRTRKRPVVTVPKAEGLEGEILLPAIDRDRLPVSPIRPDGIPEADCAGGWSDYRPKSGSDAGGHPGR